MAIPYQLKPFRLRDAVLFAQSWWWIFSCVGFGYGNLEHSETVDGYLCYETLWQGRTIAIRHNPNWLGGFEEMQMQHIEVQSLDREPLPITETGYRSHFLNNSEALAEFNHDPVCFVLAWLDKAAESKAWQDYDNQSRQGLLF